MAAPTPIRFLADRRGSIAVIFALALIPLLGLIGAGIDYSRATVEQEKIQHALDASVLAVNRQIGEMNDGQLEDYAQSVLDSNLQGATATIDDLSIDRAKRIVTMSASADVDTTFMKILGLNAIEVSASAQSVTGSSSMEIALVLDNSGSMGGSRISTLQSASQDLVQTLFGDKTVSDEVSVSVVPFAGAVNVGSANASATWMDRYAKSSIHQGMFTTPVNRFDLFKEMNGTSWKGCVEVRPAPYNTDDTAPDPARPDTLFVPALAPDEPDYRMVKFLFFTIPVSDFANSYLTDTGGTCPGSVDGMTQLQKTGQACKYHNVTPKSGTPGPNSNCDSEAITPLTNVKQTINSALGKMHATGSTNILEGVTWGWRTLSPGAPFTQGAPYDSSNNSKFMIVMTDGANTVPTSAGDLESAYTAFGYANQGRLGTNHSNSAMVQKMNDYTLEACTNVKNAGIKIFTIAFDISDGTTVDMLRRCASGEKYAFTAQTTGDLSATFAEIGNNLGDLRIAQ